MAKKKTTPDETSTAKATPERRRVPRQKTEAAPPIDIAAVAGTEPRAGEDETQPTHDEIAEAAYFRHLKRGGAEGDEFSDWIEAERELRDRQRRRAR